MNVIIECPECSAEHEYEIDEGERATRYYPGSAPTAHHLDGECGCAKASGNELRYWREMRERALEAADELSEVECPFDTVEEMRGER